MKTMRSTYESHLFSKCGPSARVVFSTSKPERRAACAFLDRHPLPQMTELTNA